MGEYTRLFLNVPLRYETPPAVREILRYMSGEMDAQPSVPDHLLFQTRRWSSLFLCSSAYHDGQFCQNRIPETFKPLLFFCADLKNYDGEIELFCDWIHPHIDTLENTFIGFMHYNHEDYPEILRYKETGIECATLTDMKWNPIEKRKHLDR